MLVILLVGVGALVVLTLWLQLPSESAAKHVRIATETLLPQRVGEDQRSR